MFDTIELMLYYNQTAQSALKKLKTSVSGLTTAEYETRLISYGLNILKVKNTPLWRKLIKPFIDIFMLVLSGAVLISLLQGHVLDAAIIGLVIVVNVSIYYIQTFSTERILRALEKHNPQNVDVIRDGTLITVDASMLVPGDIVMLNEGDKVPADCRLIEASNVRTDESILTGESEPITKSTDAIIGTKEIYEQKNTLFQGTFLISGEATALVFATGNQTEFGQIAALAETTGSKNPIQLKINSLVKKIIRVIGALSIVIFLMSINSGMTLSDSLSFVIALSVSIVPEGLPVAITVILVLGVRKMAQQKALVRNMNAIETIGSLTTIATDKTGTLTKNILTVQDTWRAEDISYNDFHQTLSGSVLFNSHKSYDPLDTAFADYSDYDHALLHKTSFPFDQTLAMSGNLWHDKESGFTLMLKGAPESIIARSDLTDNEREDLTSRLHKLTGQGYRVIALADLKLKTPIDSLAKMNHKSSLRVIGFVAVADELRPEAKQAIITAQKAGITVRMITGDHFETAYHIGRKLGLAKNREQVFDSRRMNGMDDQELAETIKDVRIFSRVTPEHKYRVLGILKIDNITAMTGDGVNDVPALASAHVGVTMGSGAQIAKDAGDIILLDDNFSSIMSAVAIGRSIIDNISKMLFYLLSTSAGEVLTMIGALLSGLPLPLLPVQILWVNLVTDTAMVIPLGLEPGDKDTMTRKPKSPDSPVLSRNLIVRMILISVTIAIVVLWLYVSFIGSHDEAYARTIAFNALVIMQLANAFNARSEFGSIFGISLFRNGKFYISFISAIALQMLVMIGPLGPMLHVTSVSIQDLFASSVVAFIAPIIVAELHKKRCRRKQRSTV